MVGLFACIGYVGRIYARWLACRLVCLLSCLSVGWIIRPAGYVQLITVWTANHPSIYLIAKQPTRYCTFIIACIRSVLEFPKSEVWRLLVFVRLIGCGGATWPMLASRWSSLERISSSFSMGYTIPPWSFILGLDLGTLKKGCVICFAMPCTYIFFMLRIQLPVILIPPILVMGCNKFLFSQHPTNRNPGRGLVWGFESTNFSMWL